jgi:hypothetical protein
MNTTAAYEPIGDREIRRTQALAWLVLVVGALLCALIALGVPFLAYRYVRTATVSESAAVEAKAGSVTIESPSGVRVPLQGGEPERVIEGSMISTDASSRAFAQLPDGSTFSLEPNSRVTLMRLRRSRFAVGEARPLVHLYFEAEPGLEARLQVGAAWGEVDYRITTVRGAVSLAPEARARLVLADNLLKVVATDGRVTVSSDGQMIALSGDQRAEVGSGLGLQGPLPAIEDRLANADFESFGTGGASDVPGWSFDRQGHGVHGAPDPGVARQERLPDGRAVISFRRIGSGGNPGTMLYYQRLSDEDVSTSAFVGISSTLRVDSQSLAGGGTQRTEFPVILNLVYESATGEDFRWRIGFYAVAPGDQDPNLADLQRFDRLVPLGEWYKLGTGNLLDAANPLGFAQQDLPRPARLRRFEIVASGHDYQSDVDSVGVWVK